MYDLLPVIWWNLCEARQDACFVAYDFASFCVRHGKIHDLISVICWQGMETVTHT